MARKQAAIRDRSNGQLGKSSDSTHVRVPRDVAQQLKLIAAIRKVSVYQVVQEVVAPAVRRNYEEHAEPFLRTTGKIPK